MTEMNKLETHRRLSSASLFFLCTLGVGLITILLLIVYPDSLYEQFLFIDPTDTFMDFFNPVSHACDGYPYTAADRIYPAFCYVGYWFISRFIPSAYLVSGSGRFLRSTQEGLFCFAVTFAAVILFLGAMVNRLYRGNTGEKLLLFLSVFFSAPFLCEYERANNILLALACLCCFFAFKDSEKRLLRELALVMLCVASAIKLYPAIFGLLLLKERRWKDILRCMLYGAVLLFVPFAFMGGAEGFRAWIELLRSGAENTLSIAQGVGYKVNFSNMVVTWSAMTGSGTVTQGAIDAGRTVALVLSVLAFLAAMVQRERWKQLMLLTGILIGLPGFSFQYCMIFVLLPLMVFLQTRSRRLPDYLYALLFSMMLMFAVMPGRRFAIDGYYPLNLSVFLEEVGLMVMTAALILDTVLSMSRQSIVRTPLPESDAIPAETDETEKPLVSICIPVYNGEKTVRQTLQAALRQTYKPLEIIVVDNGSQDGTLEILREMETDRFTVYRNPENIGMVGNWNQCLSYAKGKYAMILCADDTIEDDCIEKKVRMLETAEDVVFAFGASEVINDKDKVLLRRRLFRGNCLADGAELALLAYLTRNLFGEPTNVLFRRSALLEAGPFDEAMCYAVDLDMWLRLACRGRVAYAGDLLMKYRISTGNQTSAIRFRAFLQDDSVLMTNLRRNERLEVSLFFDIIHRSVYAMRMLLRFLFMRLET